jgi:Uncharacterised nucleotidyltransferase
MAPSPSPEFLLVAACSAWPPTDRRTDAICKLAAGGLDWTRVVQLVERHRVAGLVNEGLLHAKSVVLPKAASAIGALAQALVRQNLSNAAETLNLQRLFADADLPVVFFKGISLAMLAYGNLALRHSRDIDILPTPETFARSAAVLETAGYGRYQPPPQFTTPQLNMWIHRCKEFGYLHPEKKIEIELHCRLFDNPRLTPELPATDQLQTLKLGNGEVRTFGDEDLFAYLCAHGAVHCWFRLKWLADIAALIAQMTGGAERLYQAAEMRGVGRCAAQAMLLCHRLLGTAIPPSLMSVFRQDSAVRWLENIALAAITADRDLTDQPFGTMRKNLSLFALRSQWRYRLSELEDQCISPVDILTLPLPTYLRELYPILRLPLWLWRRGRNLS